MRRKRPDNRIDTRRAEPIRPPLWRETIAETVLQILYVLFPAGPGLRYA